MADHIFNPEILNRLQKCQLRRDECALCVDVDMSHVFDIDDATKVHTDGERILRINKRLRGYNGIDMGIFLCTPVIFSALKRSMSMARYSLTDAVSLLVSEGKMIARIFDDKEYYWFDVDTPLMWRMAEEILTIMRNVEAPMKESKRPLAAEKVKLHFFTNDDGST